MTNLLWRIFEKTGAVSDFLFYKAMEKCEQPSNGFGEEQEVKNDNVPEPVVQS